MNIIGESIKAIREKRQMTQDELSEIAGVHRVTLAKYEAGKSIPGADVLWRISKALHVKADRLLGDESDDLTEYEPEPTLTPYESELITIFRELNSKGQDALLRQARYLVSDPDMKKGFRVEYRDGIAHLIPR